MAKYGKEQSGKPKPIPKFPPLKRPDSIIANTFDGKIEALRGAFFPPPPEANLSNIENAIYPDPVLVNKVIIQDIVIKAINKLKKDKAPGPNGILNRFLLIVAVPLRKVFTYLFEIYLDIGYYLRKFKETKIIILKKLVKPDYFKVKFYRLIILLYTLRKALKIVITKILSDYIKSHGLLPN